MALDKGLISRNNFIVDEPLKFMGTPIKKSLATMGNINEFTAIARSSNVYFYKLFLQMANIKYVKDMSLNIPMRFFQEVRNYYEQFGLGTTTGINMENEATGFKGSKNLPGFYLDLANGQYDTYTNLQVAQYISTIANTGSRYKVK